LHSNKFAEDSIPTIARKLQSFHTRIVLSEYFVTYLLFRSGLIMVRRLCRHI